jgi:hypothetical protein
LSLRGHEKGIPNRPGVDSAVLKGRPSTPEIELTGSSRAEAKVMLGVWVNSGDYGIVNQSIQQKVLKEVA